MKSTDIVKKVLAEICRVLIGVVFVFSGFVKAVDPWGYTYKIQDYLEAFGMSFFDPLALPASIFISALEFAIGLCLLIGVYRKFYSIVLLLFMCVMTPLTLYLAIANPVKDCGCFGDAIIISNWETFFKNLVLLAAAIVLFLWYRWLKPLFQSSKTRPVAGAIPWVFIVAVSLYCYLYLPILDFRPYKIGNNISQQMEIPDGAPVDKFETTFIYEKDGVKETFTLDNYPKTDDWTFVEQVVKVIEKGYEPPIQEFDVFDEEGDDITDIILENEGYTFLLVAWTLEKANESRVDEINEIYDYAVENGYDFYALTSSPSLEIENWRRVTGADYPFGQVDAITLKTIIRSNPGLVLLRQGTVINKWPFRKISDEKFGATRLEDSPLGQIPPNHDVRNMIILSIVLILLYVPVLVMEFSWRKNRAVGMKK